MKSWETTLAASLRRQWKRYRGALRKCQDQFTEKAVHDSRVESRRLEAKLELLKIFAPARVFKRGRRAVEHHLDCFDTLRDTQVQLRLLRQNQDVTAGTEPLREALQDREASCLKEVAREVQRVKIGRLRKLVKALARQLKAAGGDAERQVRERRVILRAVDAAQARVAERQRRMDPGHVATIHRTRVAFKQLRYMIEALQPLFPEITRTRIEAMHDLQTQFGELQDTDVFLAQLDRFVRDKPAQASRLARFRHWLLSRRNVQIQNCMDYGGQLLEFWPLHPDGPDGRGKASSNPKRQRQRRS